MANVFTDEVKSILAMAAKGDKMKSNLKYMLNGWQLSVLAEAHMFKATSTELRRDAVNNSMQQGYAVTTDGIAAIHTETKAALFFSKESDRVRGMELENDND